MTKRAKHAHEEGCGAQGPSGQNEPCTCSWCDRWMPSLPRGTFCSKVCHEAWWEAFKADLEAQARVRLTDGLIAPEDRK